MSSKGERTSRIFRAPDNVSSRVAQAFLPVWFSTRRTQGRMPVPLRDPRLIVGYSISIRQFGVPVNITRIFLVLLLLAPAAYTQSVGGTITGTVVDASHLPLSNAAIEITQAETSRKRTAVTDATGG